MAAEHVADDGDLNDFSCYITIKNDTDVDFGLDDFGINNGYGEWVEGQPVNTIEAHKEETVHLKDPKFVGGSDGWVEYEVPVGDERATFRLDFSDPEAPWSKNTLVGQSSDPNSLAVIVQPFKTSGHPFYGNVTVTLKGSQKILVLAQHQTSHGCSMSSMKVAPKDQVRAEYDIGFETPVVPIVDKPPIHETITIAAFIKSKVFFPKGTDYNNLSNKQWEFIRGVLWNDDPSCLLFLDYSDSNHHFSDGWDWYQAYSGDDTSSIIKRSHWGDLQFLHGMAVRDGEDPKETQRKVLTWLEVMYKLACGNQGVSDNDQIQQHLGEWFNNSTKPPGSATLRDLILASTPNYNGIDIKKRALGVCLHIITDSYAVGHTQRRLTNPDAYQGRDENNFMRFKPGIYGKWGPVIVFHSYDGQNKDRHKHYDGLEDRALPVPKNLESFDSIIGARSAIESDTKLIDFFGAGTKWEDGVKDFLSREVFALDKDARPANAQVDESGPYTSIVHKKMQISHVDYDYEAGLQRKMMDLEAGFGGSMAECEQQVWMHFCFMALLFLISVAVLLMLFVLFII